MNTVAQELINDNGISAVALTFFTALLAAVGTVVVQIYQIKHKAIEAKDNAIEAKEAADAARAEAENAKENTRNVSNGFASGVDRRLTIIVAALSRIEERQAATDETVNRHLSWHLEKGKD